jgi:uncharacterized protein involved in cysteine biosynthesis
MMNTIENFINWLSRIDIGWMIVIVILLYLLLFLNETVSIIRKIVNKKKGYHNIY